MAGRRIRLLTLVCLLAALGLAGLAAAADGRTDVRTNRRADTARITSLMRQGDRAGALRLCRQYAVDFPDDAVMLYNLACLENTDGEAGRALAAFTSALAAGFDGFAAVAQDPDLRGPQHDRYVALAEARQRGLTAAARRQGWHLDPETWTPPRQLVLHAANPVADAAPASAPELKVAWRESGLEFVLTAGADWEALFGQADRAPWYGGAGLLLSIGVLPDSLAVTSDNHFLFGFGLDGKASAGAMYVATTGRWQQVLELVPKIKADQDGQLQITGTVPWQALEPYDPVIDTPLGLNATLVVDSGGDRFRASLVETNDTLIPTAPQRWLAPLGFRTDDLTGDVFLGKLDDTISSDRPLGLALVAITGTAGDGVLKLNFVDAAGRTVLPTGPVSGRIALQAGTNHLLRQADFSGLQAGGYLVQAELTFPSGQTRTWSAAVLQLPERWQDSYEERIALVGQSEQATVRYFLQAVLDAAAAHLPRRSPGAIAGTLVELDRMLASASETGTILPDKGGFVAVYPGPDGSDRLCRIYLPAGRQIADGLNPVLVLTDGYGQEARLAERIGQNYEFGKQKPTLRTGDDNRFPVYLVPEFGPGTADGGGDLIAEADACRRWALSYFAARTVALAGVDNLGTAAILLGTRVPVTLSGVLVFAGENLDPWPQAGSDFIRAKLGTAPGDLPFTWVDFRMETSYAGQARDVLAAMKDLGFRIAGEQEVRGGLNLTQIADRVVLWAEDLR